MTRQPVPRLAVLAVLWSTGTASPAYADSKDECIGAHVDAQALRKRGALLEARRKLATCARPACPFPIVQDCTVWLDELNREQPSIVVAVQTETGQAVTAATVFVDGELFASSLDGKPVDIDPGEHVVRVDTTETRVLLNAGEKGRLVSVVVASKASAPAPAPAPAPTRRAAETSSGKTSTIGIWALGGFGLVSLGAFAYFGTAGNSLKSDLRSSCAPNCELHDIQTVRTDYIVANVALGVGVVALGLAAYFWASGRGQ